MVSYYIVLTFSGSSALIENTVTTLSNYAVANGTGSGNILYTLVSAEVVGVLNETRQVKIKLANATALDIHTYITNDDIHNILVNVIGIKNDAGMETAIHGFALTNSIISDDETPPIVNRIFMNGFTTSEFVSGENRLIANASEVQTIYVEFNEAMTSAPKLTIDYDTGTISDTVEMMNHGGNDLFWSYTWNSNKQIDSGVIFVSEANDLAGNDVTTTTSIGNNKLLFRLQ